MCVYICIHIYIYIYIYFLQCRVRPRNKQRWTRETSNARHRWSTSFCQNVNTDIFEFDLLNNFLMQKADTIDAEGTGEVRSPLTLAPKRRGTEGAA